MDGCYGRVVRAVDLGEVPAEEFGGTAGAGAAVVVVIVGGDGAGVRCEAFLLQEGPALSVTILGLIDRLASGGIAECEPTIVENLKDENDVGKGVVDSEDDHGGQDPLQDAADDVEDVARQPDDDEGDGEALGGRAAEVLDDLRGEYHDPAGDGDGAAYSGQGG